MATIIDILIERHEKIRAFFQTHNEISLMADTDDEFRKVLVLSIASFFEKQITDAVVRLAINTNSAQVESLIRKKAISRQYHTYFNWTGNNANTFLSLFGKEFKDVVSAEIKQEPSLQEGCKAFLNLGQQRNLLVHENFASASIDLTLQEIIHLYKQSLIFVDYISERIQL